MSMTKTRAPGLPLDDKACYAALQAHDVRFDGRFFCGVSSTGIYCRPICRVKLPREENCTFFVSAAAAEAAGYRPCLRCRPELAPGLAPVDSVLRLARSAALIMEKDCLTSRKISELAAILGITDRHLRRVFFMEYGVSPVQYLQTQRLLLAKSLLTDTRLTVTDVAMAAGFGSIRRFNDLFKKHYHLTPNELRKKGRSKEQDNDGITLSLGYRPPYAWGSLISFLAARAIPGVESVAGDTYRRTVAVKKGETIHYGWISVANRPTKNALSVTLAPTLLPVLSRVLARIRFLFDVNCSPEKVYEKLATMDDVAPNIRVPGIRAPGCFDPFEMSVRAVLGQQISVKAASTLAMRLVNLIGAKMDTPFEELAFAFPQPDRICALEGRIENHLGPLGITGDRARSILALATALTTNSITLSYSANPREAMEKLRKLPGFGPWTVQYIAMRALGWPDAFPHTDHGVKKALSGRPPQDILTLSQKWSPWRSYATILLWNFLANKLEVQKESCTQ
ncbi:Bifunctional transcriptional activator/DNA repair enzyme AlkA [Syntrophobacter sp. SbD1]|nr:Bifunctional transcriptional activator/DNA repair enzyme AlkA [Syntrophobacter sp. SbD1]